MKSIGSVSFLNLLILGAVTIIGCSTFRGTGIENPVLPSPPPRVSSQVKSDDTGVVTLPGDNQIEQVKNEEDFTYSTIQDDSQVIAIVNGEQILAGELLAPYKPSPQFRAAEEAVASGKMTPEEFEKIRKMLFRKQLPTAIEQRILVQGLKKSLKPEQLKMIDGFLDQAFDQQLQSMQAKMGVNTLHEVDVLLRKDGSSLADLRNNFETNQLAREFRNAKRGGLPKIGRPEMLEYYRDHKEDYTVPARVKWQLLVIEFNKHGGTLEAGKRLKEAVAKLKETQDFTEVVKEYSDSATRFDGGKWDWTTKGSLSDQKVEAALFELPVGQISAPFQSDTAFKIVKVNQREPLRVIPFEKVQGEIKKVITEKHMKEAEEKLLAELHEAAVVETIFDDLKPGQYSELERPSLQGYFE